MIIPDNVTVCMNGRAYYAHVCGFYQNNERLSLSIDTSGIIPTPQKPDFPSPHYSPALSCLNQILLDIDAYLIEKYGTTEKPNHDKYGAIEYFVNEYEKLERKHNGGSSHAPILKHCRREITINAQIGGKTVNITYDPHDAEAVKAAEVWRKALFAGEAQFKTVAPIAVKGGDSVNFREQHCRDYLSGAVEKLLQNKQKHVDELAAAMEPWTPDKHPETVKNNEPAVPEIIANPGNYGVIGFWWEDWADGSCFLRWRTEPGADALKVACLTGNPVWGFQVTCPCDGAEDVAVPENSFPWKPRFFKADSKAAAMRKIEDEIRERINGDDMRRLAWIRVKEPPKVDLQQLDRAIRDLSDVVKDDQSGLHTYFDGVDMTYILECLKQYRETVGGAL